MLETTGDKESFPAVRTIEAMWRPERDQHRGDSNEENPSHLWTHASIWFIEYKKWPHCYQMSVVK